MNIRISLLPVLLLLSLSLNAMVWYDGKNPVSYYISDDCDPVVEVAAGMFADDMKSVTGKAAEKASKDSSRIRIYQLDTASEAVKNDTKNAGIDI